MADHSSETEIDPQLLTKRVFWCAAVFSLAILLSVLNFFPPTQVRYEVYSEVVVPASRLDQIESMANRKDASEQAGPQSLLEVRILDGNDSQSSDFALVELKSLWSVRCTAEEHIAWLSEITKLSRQYSADSQLARESRFARWQLQAARHYSNRHQHVSQSIPPASNVFELRTAVAEQKSSRIPARLASHSSGTPSSTNESTTEERLSRRVTAAESLLASVQNAWDEQEAQESASMKLATPPRVRVEPPSLTFFVVFSIIVVGFAAAGVGGWIQNRMHKGRAFDPFEVADKLSLQGLPVVGKVQLEETPSEESWLETTSRNTVTSARKFARHLVVLSEIVVGLWLVLIVLRLFFDPAWRMLAFENPLVAFARVLFGLP